MNMPSDILRAIEALIVGALTLLTLSNYPVVKAPEQTEQIAPQTATTTTPAAKVPTRTKKNTSPPERIYVLLAEATSSVESLMQAQRVEGTLTFQSRDYPTLGSFLESIDGLKNANGEYWMLYINGARSPSGMSQAIVIPGDYVEWRYE